MEASKYRTWPFVISLWITAFSSSIARGEPIVPGTGYQIAEVGDDFEIGAKWGFVHNFPKSSDEQDEQKRYPTGRSVNGRWYEGIKRGQPDFMRAVPTPEGGIAGSTSSLLIRTLNSGIPGALSYKMEQDDLIVNCSDRLRSGIPVGQGPSCVTRVYVPPFDQWENRSGPSFGFRISVETHAWRVPEEKRNKRNFFGGTYPKEFGLETYWPGMFIQFRSETDKQFGKDSAYFTIRGDQRGADFKGPEITEEGWWTLGMSCTGDGQVHYYIRKGVEDLTAADYIGSQFPYGYKAERFKTFFFNVCNQHDGRTWSTPWIIDDPVLFVAAGQVATRPAGRR